MDSAHQAAGVVYTAVGYQLAAELFSKDAAAHARNFVRGTERGMFSTHCLGPAGSEEEEEESDRDEDGGEEDGRGGRRKRQRREPPPKQQPQADRCAKAEGRP
jgi:hypothetical protein